MRVLILGGTGFLGRHLVEACVAAGHTVCLFNRGLTDPGAFPQVEQVHGNREVDLDGIRGRTWDVVIDTSGYEVRSVRAAARALAGAAGHYVFVSSISVYDDITRTDESAPLRAVAGSETASVSAENYGALKAACEAAVAEFFTDRVQCVRAGLILGPHDYDLRFPYWLRRIARGGEVLAPGDPEAHVQFIDARDLAAWIVRCAEKRLTGTFNATGPGESTTMSSLLETIREVTRGDARFTWVPDQVLVAHGVIPYSEMPFWVPASMGSVHVDARRAVATGLAFRPVAETARATWEWLRTGWDQAATARSNRKLQTPGGMAPDREWQILKAARPR